MTSTKRLSVVERAFEIAREGSAVTIDDVRRRLRSEKFAHVEQHIAGPTIKRQLLAAIEQRRLARGVSLEVSLLPRAG